MNEMDLRQHAPRYLGQPIIAHHKNGTVYQGILHHVDRNGIYIRPHGRNVNVSDERACDADMELAFFGGLGFGLGLGLGLSFIPWGGLGGFWGGGYYW